MKNDVIGFMRSIYSQDRIYSNGKFTLSVSPDVVPVWADNHSKDGLCWFADVFKVCFEI